MTCYPVCPLHLQKIGTVLAGARVSGDTRNTLDAPNDRDVRATSVQLQGPNGRATHLFVVVGHVSVGGLS